MYDQTKANYAQAMLLLTQLLAKTRVIVETDAAKTQEIADLKAQVAAQGQQIVDLVGGAQALELESAAFLAEIQSLVDAAGEAQIPVVETVVVPESAPKPEVVVVEEPVITE